MRLTGEEAEVADRARTREVERAEAAAQAVALSVETFNASPYRRTVQGIARTLGAPRVSLMPLGGIRPDVVITIAWDISWYQYRVDAEADPPVRLEGRGDDVTELALRWRTWNAGPDGGWRAGARVRALALAAVAIGLLAPAAEGAALSGRAWPGGRITYAVTSKSMAGPGARRGPRVEPLRRRA